MNSLTKVYLPNYCDAGKYADLRMGEVPIKVDMDTCLEAIDRVVSRPPFEKLWLRTTHLTSLGRREVKPIFDLSIKVLMLGAMVAAAMMTNSLALAMIRIAIQVYAFFATTDAWKKFLHISRCITNLWFYVITWTALQAVSLTLKSIYVIKSLWSPARKPELLRSVPTKDAEGFQGSSIEIVREVVGICGKYLPLNSHVALSRTCRALYSDYKKMMFEWVRGESFWADSQLSRSLSRKYSVEEFAKVFCVFTASSSEKFSEQLKERSPLLQISLQKFAQDCDYRGKVMTFLHWGIPRVQLRFLESDFGKPGGRIEFFHDLFCLLQQCKNTEMTFVFEYTNRLDLNLHSERRKVVDFLYCFRRYLARIQGQDRKYTVYIDCKAWREIESFCALLVSLLPSLEKIVFPSWQQGMNQTLMHPVLLQKIHDVLSYKKNNGWTVDVVIPVEERYQNIPTITHHLQTISQRLQLTMTQDPYNLQIVIS